MSQKFIKVKNNNGDSHAFGKYYATAVYDKKFIETEELAAFIQTEYSRIGADEHITPREVIRDFIELLDLLYQHPEQTLAGLLQSGDFAFAKSEAVSDQTEAGYAEFTL
jgi:hypothetical protein